MKTASSPERKRKRMQSNRESARRSRLRKQKQLTDLTAEIARISEQNNQISSSINAAALHYVKLEAHNTVLRAQMAELSYRLQSLNEILAHTSASAGGGGSCMFEADERGFAEQLLEVGHGYGQPPTLPYYGCC